MTRRDRLESVAEAAKGLVWEHVVTPSVDYWRIAQPIGLAVDKVQALRAALDAVDRHNEGGST